MEDNGRARGCGQERGNSGAGHLISKTRGPHGRFQDVVWSGWGVEEVWWVDVGVHAVGGSIRECRRLALSGIAAGSTVQMQSDKPVPGSQHDPQHTVAPLEPLSSCAKQGKTASFPELLEASLT